MKHLVFLSLTIATTSVYANTEQCEYDSLKSPSYVINESSKKYVRNNFIVTPSEEQFSQTNRSLDNYDSLANNPFKVIRTDVVTKDGEKYLGFLSKYRFRDVKVGGKPYKTDKYYNVEVVTSDCQKFYYTSDDFGMFTHTFSKADGSTINESDYLKFMGDTVVPADISATSTFDKFEQEYKITTDFFDDYMIRGYYNPKTKKLNTGQVYLHLRFYGDWGFITVAKDENGQSHEVTKIDSDVDCSSDSLGCIMHEEVGVSVTEYFLRKNKNGFDFKLAGKQTKVVSISGEMVRAFLSEIDRLK